MKVRQISQLLLILCLIIGLIGCTKKTTTSDAVVTPTPGTATNTPQATEKPADIKYKISMMDFTYGAVPPKDGAGVKIINDKFNVNYDSTIIPYANYQEKLSAVIAAGDMPDAVGIEEYLAGASLYKWAKQGAFLALNDYIDKYPSFKLIPKDVLDAVTIDGKIIAIPKYYPQTPEVDYVIRKDWLDNLGLKVPTSYDELKAVALAFTNGDPDKNNKKDTYGMAIGQYASPHYSMGPYWDWNAWYHKNSNGQLIPGTIGPGRKELVTFLADLYKQGALTKEFGAIKNFADVQKDFYSGKAGMFQGAMRGQDDNNVKALLEIQPGAKMVSIPPFKAPDGSQGSLAQKGFYTMTVLNGKLASDPGKVAKILEMLDFGRTFIPKDKLNPQNESLAFVYGKEGEGFTMKDGVPIPGKAEDGKTPLYYFMDSKMWAPSVLDNQYSKGYTTDLNKNYAAELESNLKTYKLYVNPIYQAFSETNLTTGDAIVLEALNEQVKMIMGQTPLSDWDKMVQTFMDKGGKKIIQEVNDSLKGKDLSNLWKQP